MGAVFSKKSGLNMLFVGCRSMSRDEVYGARSRSRLSRKVHGDFCHYIKNSKSCEFDVYLLAFYETNPWRRFNLLEYISMYGGKGLKNIIRWRTEGK